MATTPSAPTAERYTAAAITLHWLLALLITATFCVGLYMTGLPLSPTRLKFFNWHKWAGATILALSVLRLLWRLAHRAPAPLPAPAWQHRLARIVHTALYAFFFAVPLSGWSYSSAAGFPVVVFGVLPLPNLMPKDKELAEFLEDVHGVLAWTLAVLVLLHVAAALKHRFIDRDATLSRMWFR